MRYYPVSLDIAKRNCLVVGGGSVGTRKVKTLLRCGAIITVISEEFSEDLEKLKNTDNLTLSRKIYSASDLDGQFLVIGATDNQELNKQIGFDAGARNLLCNIADLPEACNFILPSFVNRGDLTISVSTAGKSPAFAKKLRKDLSEQFGEEYAVFLELMGAIRKKLLKEDHAPDVHKIMFTKLIEDGLLELTALNDIEKIDKLLQKILGHGFQFNDLIN